MKRVFLQVDIKDEELRERFIIVARKNETTAANLVRKWVKEYLKENDK